jgi:hypothetical protein
MVQGGSIRVGSKTRGKQSAELGHHTFGGNGIRELAYSCSGLLGREAD